MSNELKPVKAVPGGWEVVAPQGSKSTKYDKYDNQLAVMVAESHKKLSTMYISEKALKELGTPLKWVQFLKQGSELAIRRIREEDGEEPAGLAFAVSFPHPENGKARRGRGRPTLNVRSIILRFKLRAGAYSAHVYDTGFEKMIVFNCEEIPSKFSD